MDINHSSCPDINVRIGTARMLPSELVKILSLMTAEATLLCSITAVPAFGVLPQLELVISAYSGASVAIVLVSILKSLVSHVSCSMTANGRTVLIHSMIVFRFAAIDNPPCMLLEIIKFEVGCCFDDLYVCLASG